MIACKTPFNGVNYGITFNAQQVFMKILQKSKRIIREWISNKTVQQYSLNTVWMVVARFSWIITAFTVGIFVTRKLGPERFGELNYAVAWLGMFTIILDLGVGSIIQRDLVQHPEKKDRLLGNLVMFKAIQTLIMFLIAGAVLFLSNQPPQIVKLILILMIGYTSVSASGLNPYFAATVKNQYEAFAQIFSCITYNVIRLCAVIFDWQLTVYAIAESVMMLCYNLPMLYFYKRLGNKLRTLSFQFKEVCALLIPAIPLSLSGIFATIYSRTDILMLKHFENFDSVAFYTLASRFTLNIALFYALLSHIFSTAVASSKKVSDQEYRKQLHRFYFMLFWIGVPFLPVLIWIAPYIFRFLYGNEFSVAAEVFAVYVCSLPCTGLLNAYFWHCTIENKLLLMAFSNGLGAFINVFGNWYLIPRLGITGAAWSSVFSMILGLILALLFQKTGRDILRFILKSLFTLPSLRLNHSGT